MQAQTDTLQAIALYEILGLHINPRPLVHDISYRLRQQSLLIPVEHVLIRLHVAIQQLLLALKESSLLCPDVHQHSRAVDLVVAVARDIKVTCLRRLLRPASRGFGPTRHVRGGAQVTILLDIVRAEEV